MEEKPRIGSAAVIQKQDKFLLIERNKENLRGYWVLPGGKVEYGENIKQTVIREVKEETNLNIELLKFLCWKEIIAPENNYHRIVFFHLAKALNPTDLKFDDDASDAKWLTIDEIKKLKTPKSVELVLREGGFWK